MKKLSLILSMAFIAVALTGCAAMKEGMENLNNLAAEQAAIQQQEQETARAADIATGRYSGTVKVAFIPVVAPNEAKTGINQERAIAMLKKDFADHPQFEFLNEQRTESLTRALHPSGGALNASKINSRVDRGAAFGGVDADVILRSGIKTETFTGINKKTGKIGQGVKIICWAEYMAIGSDQVIKDSFEEINIFESEEAVIKTAQSFHNTVLNKLMIEHLQSQIAQEEHAGL